MNLGSRMNLGGRMKRRAPVLATMITAAVLVVGAVLSGPSTATAATAATAATGASPATRVPALGLDPNQPALPPGRVHPSRAPGATSLRFSANWSGYVATASSAFRSATTTYVQPAVKCRTSGAITVFWVGLDGWTDGTVEQDGTGAICNGSTPLYFAWWEMYPTNSLQVTMLVSAGDLITDTVHYLHGQYVLTVKDHTANTASTNVAACSPGLACSRSSAEWVIERPTIGSGTLARLADWGTMAFGSGEAATTTGGARPISRFANFAVDMVNRAGTNLLADVGGLDPSGTAFPDTWDAGG